MSREAWMSLIGMERLNPDLFADIELPNKWSAADISAFKLELFAQTAEMDLLYSDSKIMQQMISAWSHRRKPIWDKLYDTLEFEYDPLHNWDRDETRTVTSSRRLDGSNTSSNTNNRSDNLQQSQNGTVTGTGENTTKVAGFNSDTLVNREGANSSDHTSTVNTTTNTGTQTNQNNAESTNNEVESTETTDVYKASGNVGVLSPQELIQKERDIVNFDLMQIIIDEFIRRFCILIY